MNHISIILYPGLLAIEACIIVMVQYNNKYWPGVVVAAGGDTLTQSLHGHLSCKQVTV